MTTELIILIIATLLGLSVIASQVSIKFGIPTLLVFLGIGMLAGSDGIGGIHFADAYAAQTMGVVALVFILFSGAMDTNWRLARPQMVPAFSLATIGILISAIVVATAAVLVLKFNYLEGLLLGSIVASTDAAAVFAALRGSKIKLPSKISSLLEIESGSNDPIAVLLTVTCVGLILGQTKPSILLVGTLVAQLIIGGIGGYVVGLAGNWILRHINLKLYALNQVVSIVVALTAYSLVSVLGGNGFLSVYVAGLTFSHTHFAQLKGLRRFHDGIAWIMQIAMFLVLGLFVFPSQLPSVALNGLIVGIVLIFIARPISVLFSLIPFKFKANAQLLISWAGLRGAVPIVLATFPLMAGIERAQEIFNLVFFVVLLSALLQGTTLPFAPKWLKIETNELPEATP